MHARSPKLPEEYERTLRCANAALYAMTVVAVVVCVVVVWGLKAETWNVWQRAAAIGGGLLTTLWGGYYALYRVCECDQMGVSQCTILLSFSPGGAVEISSSLMNLEEVQKLLVEWRSAGLCEGDSPGQSH